MSLLSIMVWLAWIAPAFAEPEAEAAALSRLRQEALPALEQREDSAEARIEAAEVYFAGELALEGAWPELVGAPLLSPAYVQGRLLRLQEREEARIAERMAGPDPDLREGDAKRWQQAREEALAAEEQADRLERRLWVALSLGLRAAPELREAALDAEVARWRAVVGDLPDPGAPGYAEAARTAAAVGELEVVLQRYRLAAIRAMTVPGDLSLVRLVSVDLSRQAGTGGEARGSVEADAAADRVRRVAPLLPAELAGQAQQALQGLEGSQLDAQIQALQAEIPQAARALLAAEQEPAPAGATRAALEAEAAAQQRALQAIQDEVAEVLLAPEAADPLEARRREVAALRLELAGLRASAASTRLGRLAPEQVRSAEEGALRTQAQVDDAQRKAEQARLKAEQAGKEQLQALAAALSALSSEVADAEQERQRQALDAIGALQQRQQEHIEAIARAEAAPALRRGEKKAAYVEQLQWMDALRDAQRAREADTRRISAENSRIRREEIPPEQELIQAADAVPELVAAVQGSIDALLGALDERREQSLRELDQVTRILVEARAHKRALREGLRRSDRAEAERTAQVDPIVRAVDEVVDVPLIFSERFRDLRDTESWTVRGAFRQVVAFLLRSIEIVVVLLVWYVLRRRAAGWIEQLMRFVQQVSSRARSAEQRLLRRWLTADLSSLSARLAPVIPHAIDALAALVIHRLIVHASPLLGLLTLLWLMRAAMRLVAPLVDLLVVPDEDTPFALVRTTPERRDRAHRTARLLTWWWILAGILHHIAYEVMGTDFLAERVANLLAVVLTVLMARELLRWAPTIREAVAARGGAGRLSRWLQEEPRGRPGVLLRAAAGLLYLGALVLARGATLVVEGRGGLGWVGSLIAQHSLKELDLSCEPIPEAVRQEIGRADPGIVLHQAEADQIRAHYASWSGDQRRGMVALIGERGSGKGRLLRRLHDLGAREDRPAVAFAPPRRTLEPDDVLAWLAEGFGLPEEAAGSWRSLRHAIAGLPGRVVFIDDMHRLLLRAVGGFTALREALDLMHATADRHFWVCSFHGPAWAFLEGTAVPINLEVFRARVRLAPLDPATLSEWVTRTTRAAGYRIRFDNLATAGVHSAELGRELIRIESAFWRRLNDISQGNPQVAFRYWLDSLRLPAPPTSSPPPPQPPPPPAAPTGDRPAPGPPPDISEPADALPPDRPNQERPAEVPEPPIAQVLADTPPVEPQESDAGAPIPEDSPTLTAADEPPPEPAPAPVPTPEPAPVSTPALAPAPLAAAEVGGGAGEEERVLDVSLMDPPDPSTVEGLSDVDMFVLTAILIHDGLSVALLARSLNAPLSQMRSSCRYLESLGILQRSDEVYRIHVPWRPVIARLLRQKHFIHHHH